MSLCECGCGKPTVVSHTTDRYHGWIKGVPRRFLAGHNGTANRNVPVEEDRGFDTPCLIWPGALNHAGYSRSVRDGRSQQMHRWYWEQANGPIPAGGEIDHLCRVRACVRVDHMEVVSRLENVRRGALARARTSNHPFAQLRVTLGLTQGEAAKLLGVSRALIGLWENGKSTMRATALADLRDLAEGYGDTPEPVSTTTFGARAA